MQWRANEVGTASNSAEKKSGSSEGVAEGGGWGEEFRHARAEAKRFRRLGIKTSKQNNFQFLLRKIWRAGDKKLKENCFALLAEIRQAETRSGAIQAFFVQKRFELRSVIATRPKILRPRSEDFLQSPGCWIFPANYQMGGLNPEPRFKILLSSPLYQLDPRNRYRSSSIL